MWRVSIYSRPNGLFGRRLQMREMRWRNAGVAAGATNLRPYNVLGLRVLTIAAVATGGDPTGGYSPE